jgi:hypothetical protein
MPRTLITFFFTYILIHLFYGISGFDPMQFSPKWLGYLIDLGIWMLLFLAILRALGALHIGKTKNEKIF